MISEWPGTSSGPGVVLSVTPGAIQALGVLFKAILEWSLSGTGNILKGPGVVFNAT